LVSAVGSLNRNPLDVNLLLVGIVPLENNDHSGERLLVESDGALAAILKKRFFLLLRRQVHSGK
jgi:hypothetical protein